MILFHKDDEELDVLSSIIAYFSFDKTKPNVIAKKYAPDGYIYQNIRYVAWDDEQEIPIGDVVDIYYHPTFQKFYITTELDPKITISIYQIFFYRTDRSITSITQEVGNKIEQIQDNVRRGLALYGGNGQQGWRDIWEVFSQFAEYNLPDGEYYIDYWIIDRNWRANNDEGTTAKITLWLNEDNNQYYATTYISYFANSYQTTTLTPRNIGSYYEHIGEVLIDYGEYGVNDTQAEITVLTMKIIYYNYDPDPENKEKNKNKIEELKSKILELKKNNNKK